jgi:hypothetical protein
MGNELNKMTAVEWLWEQIDEILPFSVDTETGIKLYYAKEQAKQMEKEQIQNAYLICHEEYTAYGKHWEMGMNPKETFEEYYNETYGGKK